MLEGSGSLLYPLFVSVPPDCRALESLRVHTRPTARAVMEVV
jgi:hypothetical protein